MGIFKRKSQPDEQRSLDLRTLFNLNYYGSLDQSYINNMTAFENEAMYSSVKIIAETLAGLPINLFQKSNSGRLKDNSYFLYKTLNDPNGESNKFSFWEAFFTNLLLHGNAYARIYRDKKTGRALSLYLMPSNFVKVKRNDQGKIEYHFTETGKPKQIIDKQHVFHVLGTSYNGLVGLSPIELFKLQILESITADNYNYNFFDKGLLSNVILNIPEKADYQKEHFQKIIKQFQSQFTGLKNQNKPIILDHGTEIKEFKGYSNKDNSIVELRKEASLKIARIYRIPPHMLQLLDNATYSNISHQSQDFYKQTLLPWIQRFESAIKQQLIPYPDKPSRYVKLNTTSVLRGVDSERASFYDTMQKIGVFSINEIRELEDMPRLSDKGADYHFIQLNTAPVEAHDFSNKDNTNEL